MADLRHEQEAQTAGRRCAAEPFWNEVANEPDSHCGSDWGREAMQRRNLEDDPAPRRYRNEGLPGRMRRSGQQKNANVQVTSRSAGERERSERVLNLRDVTRAVNRMINVKGGLRGGCSPLTPRGQAEVLLRRDRRRRSAGRCGSAAACAGEKGSSASVGASGGRSVAGNLRSSRTQRAKRASAVSSIHCSSNAAIFLRRLAA